MADDRNHRGYRPGAPAAGAGAQGVDPLTELARLIGQSDPFAIDPNRVPVRDPRAAAPAARRDPAYPDLPAPRLPAADPYRDRAGEGMFPRSGGAIDPPLGYDDSRYRDGAAEPDYGEPRGYGEQGYGQQGYGEQGYGEQGFADPRHGYPPQAAHAPHFPADRPLPDDGRGYDEMGLAGTDSVQAGLAEDPYYDGDGRHDDGYNDAPAPRRRRGLVAVIAIFALAVVGTAGAFAYRAVFTGPSGPAPVIRADNGPNKVVPVAVPGDNSKQIYDRIPDKNQNERVVSREEQPVEIRDATRPPAPRMVVPGAAGSVAANAFPPPMPQPAQTSGNFAPASLPATASAPAASTAAPQEPRKIRTVTIRPDQGAAASARASAGSPPAARPAQGAAGSSGGPLSLTPDGVSAPQAAEPAAPKANSRAVRTVAVAPPAEPPAAAPVANTGGSGGYVVQVSAQNSEGEAKASFRAMQAKYPSQLGGRAPIIRRKDTPGGVKYGAQVGPFGAREEATQLCEGLKAAGGSCFVQKN